MVRPTSKRLIFGSFGLLPMAIAVLAYHPLWPAKAAQVPTVMPRNFTWGIAWHPVMSQPERFPPSAQLRAAKDLGLGLMRFDVRWADVQSAPGKLDRAKLPHYRALVEDCRARGFQTKVNLGSYPAWAIALLKEDPDAFFAEYRCYVDATVEALGPTVDYYQLGNEFNTILDPIPAEHDARVFKEAKAALVPHQARHPEWKVKTVINVCDTFYLPWKKTLEGVLEEASAAIDVIGYDFYPGNYSHLHDWSAWPEIGYLSELMIRYDKEGAICETGCLAFFGEGRQARWIQESTRAMLAAIAQSPVKERFLFAAYYELVDADKLPAWWLPHTEATFGLITTTGRQKPGFEALRAVISETRSAQGLSTSPDLTRAP